MAIPYVPAGQATRFTATGISVVTSGAAQVMGVLFNCSTSGAIQLFAGVTASVSASPVIKLNATATSISTFVRYPAMVSGLGLTVQIPANSDPDITLFWNPLSTA